MEKISLNNYKMNMAVKILKQAITSEERKHFKVQCKNCTISIVTENFLGRNKGTVEVALRNTDDSAWIILDKDGYEEDRPIIPALPIIAFPAFVRQFNALEPEDFSTVWDAWDTISCYPMQQQKTETPKTAQLDRCTRARYIKLRLGCFCTNIYATI